MNNEKKEIRAIKALKTCLIVIEQFDDVEIRLRILSYLFDRTIMSAEQLKIATSIRADIDKERNRLLVNIRNYRDSKKQAIRSLPQEGEGK